MIRKRLSTLLWICLMVMGATTPALAHRIVLSAWISQGMIEGEVLFSDGTYAPADTQIMIRGQTGSIIGNANLDADGIFQFTPHQAMDYHFKVDLGAGHIAETTVFSDQLKFLGEVESLQFAQTLTPSPTTQLAQSKDDALSQAHLSKVIASVVKQEIQPLRRALTAYQEKRDLQSIIGGIGYIIGIFALIYFVMQRKKNK